MWILQNRAYFLWTHELLFIYLGNATGNEGENDVLLIFRWQDWKRQKTGHDFQKYESSKSRRSVVNRWSLKYLSSNYSWRGRGRFRAFKLNYSNSNWSPPSLDGKYLFVNLSFINTFLIIYSSILFTFACVYVPVVLNTRTLPFEISEEPQFCHQWILYIKLDVPTNL